MLFKRSCVWLPSHFLQKSFFKDATSRRKDIWYHFLFTLPPRWLQLEGLAARWLEGIAMYHDYKIVLKDDVQPNTEERDVRGSMLRGWRRTCPNCGRGPLMKSYLAVRDSCPVCDEDLSHHRADDGPAYLTILIVGHLMAPGLIWAFTEFRPDPMILASTFTVGCVALSLYLLPRLKGAIVGLQWAKRLHGFGASNRG